jgi:nitrogenase molybdenum-iron protein alpha chain
MAIDVKSKLCGSRETRIGSITGYSGTLHDIGQQLSCSGCPEEKKRCFSQAVACPAMCALGQASEINDVAVVHHGPAGCATIAQAKPAFDLLANAIGREREHFAYTCTDMTEADTVFGAVDNLKEVIVETYNRYHPKAIFIGASCVSGIIGEDLEGVIDEIKEEIGDIPIAPIHCEGFKSQIWASGFDATYHAVLKYIVKPPKKKTNKVNIIGFTAGMAWNTRADIIRMLGVLGLEPTFLLAASMIEELEHLSEATASITTCSTLSSYLGVGLETAYGVPFVRSLQPHGITGYEDLARQLAKLVGKETEMEAFLREERAIYLPKIEQIAKQLAGKRAMVAMGPNLGANISRVLQEFGMKIEHLTAWHFDKQYDDGTRPQALQYLIDHSPNNFTYSVNHLQNFEYMNILSALKPDIFISRHPDSAIWAMKIGIPGYCVYDEYNVFGYKGTLRFGKTLLDLILNRSFAENLSKHVRLPYTEWWMNQKPDTFLVND